MEFLLLIIYRNGELKLYISVFVDVGRLFSIDEIRFLISALVGLIILRLEFNVILIGLRESLIRFGKGRFNL